MKIQKKDISIQYEDGSYTLQKADKVWHMPCSNREIVLRNERTIAFHSAKHIEVKHYVCGYGEGIQVCYRDFLGVNFAFDTIVWVEEISGDIIFEWIAINEHGYDIKEIMWPHAIHACSQEGYSLLPYMQGVLLPHEYAVDYDEVLPFHGQLCSSAAYMPWLAQVEANHGYLMIVETPWDARYQVQHRKHEVGTQLQVIMLPSLAKMDEKRVVRYMLFNQCDATRICKAYRNYVKQQGKLVTLKEKELRNEKIKQLVGSCFVHTKIKTHIEPTSIFYDQSHLPNNDSVVGFEEKITMLKELKQMGAQKLYVHLDGWGQPGYDNGHPDYLPVCKEAGGYEGLKTLLDYAHKQGILVGLHDQYRDYYKSAKTYDKRFALQNSDGSYYEHARWAGGAQNYLCTTQAKYYVKRNYEQLLAKGIHMDASYLDVFTCNELDECIHPLHKMTRKQCMEQRTACFTYLQAKHILVSSEECNDWAIASQEFAHYGPYEFMLKKPNTPKMGIAIPLFNLVYHDCIILPWPMEVHEEDYMLYALLNGGAPYLIREGAYLDVDGAFDGKPLSLQEKIERCQIVSDFHAQVAYDEMVSHTFLSADYQKQCVRFASGKCVTIDLRSGEYSIK